MRKLWAEIEETGKITRQNLVKTPDKTLTSLGIQQNPLEIMHVSRK